MRYLAILLLMAFGFAAHSHDDLLGNRLDFKIGIIEQNFGSGVIHLPNFSKVRALNVTNIDGSRVVFDAEYCFTDPQSEQTWKVFERRYERRAAEITTEFSSSSYTADIKASVKSIFGISGEARLEVKQSFQSPGNTFRIDVDSFAIDRNVMSVSDQPYCSVYHDLMERNIPYSGETVHIVQNAFFVTGTVSHSYEVALTGSGSGSISSGRIVEFLERAGLPKRIASLFEIQGELSVGGGFVRSRETSHFFGNRDSFASAFLPLTIDVSNAQHLIEQVNGLGGQAALEEALTSYEAALIFLEEIPSLDVLDEQFRDLFGGEGIVPYSEYPDELRSLLSRYLSTILEINRVARRI